MIHFFDSNCLIGARNIYREGSLKTLEDFVEMMNLCGIDKAIVSHSCAKESNMMTGNLLLADEIGNDDRFIQQWMVMPACVDEFPDEGKLLMLMKKHHVKCVRLEPATFHYSLEPYAFGGLAAMLSKNKIPVFIDRCQTDLEHLARFLNTYPDLTVILTDTGYRDMRQLTYLLKAFSNLHIETSTFVTHNGVKLLVEQFGAHRIIFGSGMPKASAAASVSLIRYSDISDEDKEKIAHGNIERLLGEVMI